MREENLLELRTRTVKRCLWQVDHDGIRRDLERESTELQAELNTKYNFDFRRCVPFEGRYEWQASHSRSIPKSSKRPKASTKKKSKSSTVSKTCRRRNKTASSESKAKDSLPSPKVPAQRTSRQRIKCESSSTKKK